MESQRDPSSWPGCSSSVLEVVCQTSAELEGEEDSRGMSVPCGVLWGSAILVSHVTPAWAGPIHLFMGLVTHSLQSGPRGHGIPSSE